DSEHTGLGVIDDLDDAPAINSAFAVFQLLDPQQRAVADTCHRTRLRPSRNMDADLGWFAVFHLIPFGGRGDQFAVGVAPGDVAIMVAGSAAVSLIFLPRLAITPSSASSRKI